MSGSAEDGAMPRLWSGRDLADRWGLRTVKAALRNARAMGIGEVRLPCGQVRFRPADVLRAEERRAQVEERKRGLVRMRSRVAVR